MYSYSFTEWTAFFFVYCFIGWCWEVFYVGITKRKLVNRGFLHMPLLPIYGFGAVIMLHSSLPFQNSIILTFISGMISATLLELITGLLMEKLLKVRYWDYSRQKLNFKGIICLSSSLFWGLLTVLLVKFVDPFVSEYVLDFELKRHTAFITVLIVISVLFVIDTVASVRDAINLAQIVQAIDKAKDETKKAINERIDELEEKADKRKQKIHEKTKNLKARDFAMLKRNPTAGSKKHHQALAELKHEYEEYKLNKKAEKLRKKHQK